MEGRAWTGIISLDRDIGGLSWRRKSILRYDKMRVIFWGTICRPLRWLSQRSGWQPKTHLKTRGCNYSFWAHDDERCLPKHVEQLRNIGIINSTTRSHLVGSFYVFYITMHGSMNIKCCTSSNEIDSPVRGQTVYTRRWPAVRGHVHGNSPLVLFPHVSSKSRDVNIIKPSVSKGRWSQQNVFPARPATAVPCWHPTVPVAPQQASFH